MSLALRLISGESALLCKCSDAGEPLVRKPAIVDNTRKLRRFKAHPDKHGLKKPRQCLTVGEFRAAMAACGRRGACSELTQSCDFAGRQKGQFSRRCASIF